MFGLFAKIGNADDKVGAVKNLTLNVYVTHDAAVQTSAGYIVPVAAYNYGTIEDVTVNCEIVTLGYAHGVVAQNYGTIERVKVNGWIESKGAKYAVGIVRFSYNGSTISHCVNNATIKGSAANTAGLAGTLTGRLEYSANHGDVSTTTGNYTGGLVGQINNSGVKSADIYNCYNAGAVTGYHQISYTGGLVGGYGAAANAFTGAEGIKNSFNFGEVHVSLSIKSQDLTGQSAAIIGGSTSGYQVLSANVYTDGFEDVYYLDGCADLVFGYGSTANNEDYADQIAEKFISKDVSYFSTSLYDDLNNGEGGKDGENEGRWRQGSFGFPRPYRPRRQARCYADRTARF
jgi:hypothetical protein